MNSRWSRPGLQTARHSLAVVVRYISDFNPDCLNAPLDLQAPRYGLIVLLPDVSSLNAALDLQVRCYFNRV